MDNDHLLALIDDLRLRPSEATLLEFKRMGRLISAIANSAAVVGRQRSTKNGTCRRNRKFPTTRTTKPLLTSLADMDGNRTPGLLLCTPTPGLRPHLRWT